MGIEIVPEDKLEVDILSRLAYADDNKEFSDYVLSEYGLLEDDFTVEDDTETRIFWCNSLDEADLIIQAIQEIKSNYDEIASMFNFELW
jgi:hypothetical protein